MAPIVPTARSLYLCDHEFGTDAGKFDLYGIFNAIRPTSAYPYVKSQFCVFAQLANGLGRVPFQIDIREADSDQLIYTTRLNTLLFPSRTVVIDVAISIQGCTFPRPGLYVVELFCNNVWVCDAAVSLLESIEE